MKTGFTHLAVFLLLMVSLTAAKSQAGHIDTGFGENGYVKVNFDVFGGRFNCLLPQTDGKIVAIGINPQMDVEAKRFLSNGQYDTQFGTNGTVIFQDMQPIGSTGALLADGKILVVYAGISTVDGTTKLVRVVRLLPNGAYDTSFGVNGLATIEDVAIEHFSDRVHLTAGGDIVLVGTDEYPSMEVQVLKLKPNGTLDANFGENGVLTLPASHTVSIVRSVSQSLNRIAIAASSFNESAWFTVYQIYDNGVADPAFGTDGKKEYYFSNFATVGGIVALPGGKLAVSSSPGQIGGYEFYLTKINANGDLDTDFWSTGTAVVEMDAESLATGLAVQADGKFLIGGMTGLLDGEDYAIARVFSDGTLDNSFGTNGIAKTLDNVANHCATTMTLQPNGKLLIGGFTTAGQASIARYLTQAANSAGETNLAVTAVSIFPNPVVADATIQFSLAEGKMTNLELLDASGRVVFQKKAHRQQGWNVETLPMNDLGAGFYFVKIESGGTSVTRQVEKIR